MAAHKATKLAQVEPVSGKGGRGQRNPTKTAILADAKKAGLSDSTAKRVIAKAAGKKPKPKPIPKALLDTMREIQAELDKRGVTYVRACVWDAEQSEAMGGPAEPTIGYLGEPCVGDAARATFNEAVAAVRQSAADIAAAGRVGHEVGEVLAADDEASIVENALDLVKRMTKAEFERFYGLLLKRHARRIAAMKRPKAA